MCDQDHYDDDLKAYKERAAVSRREFGALAAGAGMAFVLQRPANAVAVTESDVKIKTPDGTADCYFVHPASGAAAGVIMWPDILGLRPAFRQMGKRLAESGYAVLVVNPFYRMKPAPVVPDGAKFSDPAVRNAVMPLSQGLNATTQTTDAKAFISWLDSQAAVDKKKKIGTMGFCMPGWGTGTPEGEKASWELVHFIRRLPKLTEDDLAAMQQFNPVSRAQLDEEKNVDDFLNGGDPPPPSDPHAAHKHQQ